MRRRGDLVALMDGSSVCSHCSCDISGGLQHNSSDRNSGRFCFLYNSHGTVSMILSFTIGGR